MIGFRRALSLLLAIGLGCSLFAAAPKNAAAFGGWTGKTFTASEAFHTNRQGADGWSYEDWDGSTYAHMAY